MSVPLKKLRIFDHQCRLKQTGNRVLGVKGVWTNQLSINLVIVWRVHFFFAWANMSLFSAINCTFFKCISKLVGEIFRNHSHILR